MTTAVNNPGCVIFLLDESSAMASVVSDGTKSKAESMATALNSLLNQLTTGPDFPVALVGYRSDREGRAQVGTRWGGSLAGRDFVSVRELASSPLRVEDRIRRVPVPGGLGAPKEETIRFPVWYAPELGDKAPQIAAFEFCHQLFSTWLAGAGPTPGTPALFHVSGGASGDGNPKAAVDLIGQLALPGGPPLVFHTHLGSSTLVPPTLYPSNRAYLALGPMRDLFERTSVLPSPLAAALREAKVAVNPNARGMVYDGKMADLIRFFSLVKAVPKLWPAAAPAPVAPVPPPTPVTQTAPFASPTGPSAPTLAPTPATVVYTSPTPGELDAAEMGVTVLPDDPMAALVLVLDRSTEDPFRADLQNVCTRLQEHANELLGEAIKVGKGRLDVAVVTYGGPDGQVETTFRGPLMGRTFVCDTDLAEGALRIDQTEEEVPNGIGGIITVKRKKRIFVEVEPTLSGSLVPAFQAVRQLLTDWCRDNSDSPAPPVVLHLTRGRCDLGQIEQAAGELQQVAIPAGTAALYHLVVTEAAHRSLSYPGTVHELQDEVARKLWELSSPLLKREQLAQTRPGLGDDSRGFVINGKFDLLLPGLMQALED